MEDHPAKRARVEPSLGGAGPAVESRPKCGGSLSEILQETIYWSRIIYGTHPSALLPPPPGLEALAGDEKAAGGQQRATAPPSILKMLDRWISTNPVYGTAPLEARDTHLEERHRISLVKVFLENIPQRMRDAPLVPELATSSYDSYMLRLGRRYGTDPAGEVPYCCNGQSCAALKIKRSFGTPLQRYYTPTEDEKLQQNPGFVAEFGPGPCLICIRHDVECIVKCNRGRAVNPQQAFGQPYAVMLRVYNSASVPGGYRADVFSSTPIESPDISPVPLAASRTEDISWQYDNAARVWYVDQTPLVFSPGAHDF